MKKFILVILVLTAGNLAKAQKLDSLITEAKNYTNSNIITNLTRQITPQKLNIAVNKVIDALEYIDSSGLYGKDSVANGVYRNGNTLKWGGLIDEDTYIKTAGHSVTFIDTVSSSITRFQSTDGETYLDLIGAAVIGTNVSDIGSSTTGFSGLYNSMYQLRSDTEIHLLSNKIGVQTQTPDSVLTVNGSFHTNGGVRHSGIPTTTDTASKQMVIVDASGTFQKTSINSIAPEVTFSNGSGTGDTLLTNPSANNLLIKRLEFTGAGVGSVTPTADKLTIDIPGGGTPKANEGVTLSGDTVQLGGNIATNRTTTANKKRWLIDNANLNLTTTGADSVPLTFAPSAAATLLKINRPTAYAGGYPFKVNIANVDNGNSTYNSPVVMGFNAFGDDDINKGGNWTSIEPDYQPSGAKYKEFHYETYRPNDVPDTYGTNFRLMSSTFVEGANTASATNQWDFRGNKFYLSRLSGSPYAGIHDGQLNLTPSSLGGTDGLYVNVSGAGTQLINTGAARPFIATTGWSYVNLPGVVFYPSVAYYTNRVQIDNNLSIGAGVAGAYGSPFKLTAGVSGQTTKEAGAINYDGSNITLSDATYAYTLVKSLPGSATLDFPSVASQSQQILTITVTGAAGGDVVSVGVPNAAVTAGIIYSASVTATNTVTVTAHNYTVGALDPASGTFKVSVIK